MATSTTHNVYVPKELHGPIARYLYEHNHLPVGKLIQQALREKLTREGYLSSPDDEAR
jgi:hypothetical protein